MRIVATLLSVFLSVTAFGQSIALLDKVPGHRVTFDYSYSLSKDGKPMEKVTGGLVTVEENCFTMTGLGLEVRSDGTTRWTLDREAKEMLIETVESEDLFTNPALFIASYKNYRDRLHVNASGPDSLDITLTLDEGVKARFLLKGIVFSDPTGEKKDFTVDEKSLDSSYVVTDLR